MLLQCIYMFKEKMREFFIQYWNSELNLADVNNIRNGKLRTYKMFKSKFSRGGWGYSDNLCFKS